MGNVSSNSLFHFMKKFEYLEEVIEGKMYPRYYKENLKPFFKEPVYIGMKCFCDIPLSLIKTHTKTYGEYAIGLNKKWAIENSINPITYYNLKSSYVKSIRDAYNENIKIITKYETKYLKDSNDRKKDEDDFQTYANIKNMMQRSFLNFKPVSGKMWRENKWTSSKNFYNEREWRYITKIDNISFPKGRIAQYILEAEIEINNIEEYNRHLKENDSVDFSHKDINFIILKTDLEILKLNEKIDTFKIEEKDKAILKSKIVKFSDLDKNI